MSYTNNEIRAAILRAADRVQNEPGCYDFGEIHVPVCGTRGCMWGWIGFELGMEAGTNNLSVSDALGYGESNTISGTGTDHLYQFCKSLGGRPHQNALAVPAVLRLYADKYFPADDKPALEPAYLAFRAALGGAMSEPPTVLS